MCCLRSIARIKRRDKVPSTEVLRICVITGIEAMLLQAQLRLVGHVVRMPDIRVPKQVFYRELEAGRRLPGGPVKRYNDSPKISLKACGITPRDINTAALQRNSKLLSRALKQTELTRYVTNVQIRKQLQQRPRACGPDISAVARAPPGSVSTPTKNTLTIEIRRITTARSMIHIT